MKKALRAARWAVANGAFASAIYLGTVAGNPYAWNLVRFFVVFMAISCSIAATSDEVKARAPKEASVPAWLSGTYDVLIVSALAATGHFVFAGLYTWAAMVSHGLSYPRESA